MVAAWYDKLSTSLQLIVAHCSARIGFVVSVVWIGRPFFFSVSQSYRNLERYWNYKQVLEFRASKKLYRMSEGLSVLVSSHTAYRII